MIEPHIIIGKADAAQVWYIPEQDQIILRHAIMEGEFSSFIQNEYDSELTPGWEYQGWEFIGVL